MDVRLVSATNRDLKALVKTGGFREDLFYRVAGVELRLPPLRERVEDIPLLVDHFLTDFAKRMDRQPLQLAEDTASILMRYSWPGNIRQLINVVQNAMILAGESQRIEPRHLPPEILDAAGVSASAEGDAGGDVNLGNMSLEQLEKQAVRNALRVCGGNREQAAKMLGIGERTLYRKLKDYGLK